MQQTRPVPGHDRLLWPRHCCCHRDLADPTPRRRRNWGTRPFQLRPQNLSQRQNNKHAGRRSVYSGTKQYRSTRQDDLETECECVWVKLDIYGEKSFYVAGFYRPDVSDPDSIIQLHSSVLRIKNRTRSHVWISGDFNFPGFDWADRTLKPGCPHPSKHNDFIDFLDELGLDQIVKENTRDKNTLDLFLTSNSTLVNQATIIPGLSDHDAVSVESRLSPLRPPQKPRKIPLYKKANWEGLKDHMTDFYNKLSEEDKHTGSPNSLWVRFRTALETGIGKYIPHRSSSKRDRHPWMSQDLKKMIRKRKEAFTRKRRHPNRANTDKYKHLQAKVQKKFRQEYWTYVNNILTPEEGNNQPETPEPKIKKNFWTYLKHCKNDSIGVAPLRDTTTGILHTDPQSKAELLNKQFQSVFSLNTPLNLYHNCLNVLWRNPSPGNALNLKRSQEMTEFTISVEGVLKLLASLKPHKAAGPDQLNPRVLKEIKEAIAPSLKTIFTRSYQTGQVPHDWKQANVVPIYKKGPKHLAVNYRPVSLTCICSKLMEHIMVSQISRHLDTHKILLKNQHGFLSRLSCETQLLEFVQELHDNLNNGQQVDAIIMDFSKAFDKVAHNRLLHKLDNYGISGKANRWIADFLSGRSQQVVVEGCASGKVPVTSGVPQGSVLGPVLFLVYINDIADKTSSAVRLFADDTIIYRPITTVNDQTTLQKDLNALDHWSRVWQMEFHPSKCQTLHITRSPKPLLTNYNLYGQQIEAVDSAKYLGVTLTPDLRWNNHVHSVRNKSSATMRLLQRNMRISSTQIKTRAYNTYVRPQLEYAATIWDPHTKQNIKKLEQVQRTAARWTLGRYRNTSSVSDMLNELGWRSLEQRRADARLVMMYKLRNNMLAIDPSPYLKPAQGSIARVYPHRYITLDTNTKIYARSFYPNTIRQWNCLPPHVALAPTLNAFKRQVCQLQHPHWDHG